MLQKAEQTPVRVAYERRNRDLDPQLVWRGKDEQDWSELVVHAPPLYIQEKVHSKALIDDLLRETREREHEAGQTTPDLFADFNGMPKGVAFSLHCSFAGDIFAHQSRSSTYAPVPFCRASSKQRAAGGMLGINKSLKYLARPALDSAEQADRNQGIALLNELKKTLIDAAYGDGTYDQYLVARNDAKERKNLGPNYDEIKRWIEEN